MLTVFWIDKREETWAIAAQSVSKQEAILREKPELRVVRGDMPDTWIHGIGSMPVETPI